MSILTKIFVVLVTVLSVLLVALIVPFVANQENFKSQVAYEKQQRQAADEKARDYQVEINAAQEAVREQISALNDKNQKLTIALNTLQSDLANARTEKQNEAAEVAQLKAQVSLLSAAENQNSKLLGDMQTELGERREAMVKLDRQRIELSDRANQLQGDNEALVRSLRRSTEYASAADQRFKELEDRVKTNLSDEQSKGILSGGAGLAARPFESEREIRGKITKVETVEGTTFVQVNVGQKDLVEPNMRFLVYRGDNQYVGTIVISAVDTDASAGRVVLTSGKISEGDSVLSGAGRS